MSNGTITKFKFFWPDQDLEQEQWLREMARQGLHLKGVNILSRWTFVQGTPAEMVYRLDFNAERDGSAFHQLFEDAGWEYAAACTGWHYWRKAAVKGQASEIFSDSQSKTGKFKRLLLLVAVGLVAQVPIVAMLATVPRARMGTELSTPSFVGISLFVGAVFVLYAYMGLRLLRRIRTMRNAGI